MNTLDTSVSGVTGRNNTDVGRTALSSLPGGAALAGTLGALSPLLGLCPPRGPGPLPLVGDIKAEWRGGPWARSAHPPGLIPGPSNRPPSRRLAWGAVPRPVAAVLRAPPWRGEAGGPGAGAWGGSAAALGPLHPARRLPVVGDRLRGGVCGPARVPHGRAPRSRAGRSAPPRGPPLGPGPPLAGDRGGFRAQPGRVGRGAPVGYTLRRCIREDAPRMSAAATPGNPHFTDYRHPVLPLSPPRFAPYPGGLSAPPIRGDFDQFSRFLGDLGAIYNFLDGLDSIPRTGYNGGTWMHHDYIGISPPGGVA